MAGREKRQRVDPKAEAVHHIKNKSDKLDSLEALYINAEKGHGVFAERPFNQGDFILEYRGDLISDTEAQRRREVYTPTQHVFMFNLAGKSLCVDGAKEDGPLGRLVNDDHKNPNSRMRLVEVDKKIHICLFVIWPISISEEISYDYGGKDWTWRKKAAEVPPRSQPDSAVLDMVIVPSMESALNTPPATVAGVSSCTESHDKKPTESLPRTLPDSALVDKVVVPMEQPTKSALITPPATVGGISSCPESCDKKSVDKKTAEQTQTKQKMDGAVDQLGDESEWDSSSVDMGNEYIPPKDECEDSTDYSSGSEELRRKEKRTTKKGHTVSSKSRAPRSWKTRSSIPTTSKSPGREDDETPLSPPSVSVRREGEVSKMELKFFPSRSGEEKTAR